MATRSNKRVNGRSVLFSVKKPGGSDFIPTACASDIKFKSDKGEDSYSCRSGSGTLPDGDDPTWGLDLEGFYFIYASGEEAANVSFKDFVKWHLDEEFLECKWTTGFVGDPVFTGILWTKGFQLAAPNKGLATYSVTLSGSEKFTMGTVPAPTP